MIPEEIKKLAVTHLGDKLEQGNAVLFTGAGFSASAGNISGKTLPAGIKLRDILWEIAYPGIEVDPESNLQDVFTAAQLRQPTRLVDALKRALTVNASTLPEFYRHYFAAPWARVYTLNLDDTERASAERLDLPREIVTISATAPDASGAFGGRAGALEVVHLNGTLEDLPNDATFTRPQYGMRAGSQEPWYAAFVSHFLSHSVVFVGSKLDESLLWQHIQLRQLRGDRTLNELRPRSYLVTPHLDRAKEDLLGQYNVLWIPATAQEFADEVLAPLSARSAAGITFLQVQSHASASIRTVAQLAIDPAQNSEFLMGDEPIWADIQSGRAIEREHDAELARIAREALQQKRPGILVLTGTAGSGKSAAEMRLGLVLTADGIDVGWIDKTSDVSPQTIRRQMKRADRPDVLIIDDADIFGKEISAICKSLTDDDDSPLVILGIRSGRIDRVIDRSQMGQSPYLESAVPHLTDSDIEALLAVLDKYNRLGKLLGRPRQEQHQRFAEYAGRELLVAMISATSSEKFTEKPILELNELLTDARFIYGTVATASAFRFDLSRSEILMAVGGKSNQALNVLETLLRRHLLKSVPGGNVRARHRVIAELIFDEVKSDGQAFQVLRGLTFAFATQVSDTMPRNSRPWRALRYFLNHDFLSKNLRFSEAQRIYSELEEPLAWDYHFWLQRGSLEVEFGSLPLAELYLSHAVALHSEDPKVKTEWAYLLFKKAIEIPGATQAPSLAEEATGTLEEMIESSGSKDSYPCHVLGSQGLAWARRGIANPTERLKFLNRLVGHLTHAQDDHPQNEDIKQLLSDLKRETLMTVVE